MSLAEGPLAFVDVETTGGHAGLHRITEIAIVAMDAGEEQWRWSMLVNPGTRIPPGIERLTGISHAMVADAPRFEDVASQILERLQGRRFVAHNARFDYGFVRNEMRRAGYRFTAPVTCTVRLSRELFPDAGRHNLDAVIARHALHCDRRHRALPDAAVLAQFWRVLLTSTSPASLDDAIERVSRRPSLPAQLPVDLADDLPESPGVYRFLGESTEGAAALLYVGKANNLRERVLSHFGTALSDGKSQRLAAQVKRVEWQETAGELGALLREAKWVREQQPVYNRRLRGGGERWTWWLAEPQSTPQLLELVGEWPSEGDLFGLYRSAREARKALESLATEARLCRKVLGLEATGTGSCFGYQIGRCAGACVNKESRVKHGLRAALALSRQKLRRWPWSGAVAIEERNSLGISEYHVLNHWSYLGSLRFSQDSDLVVAPELHTHPVTSIPEHFDIDTYRILSRFLDLSRLKVRPWPFENTDLSAVDTHV